MHIDKRTQSSPETQPHRQDEVPSESRAEIRLIEVPTLDIHSKQFDDLISDNRTRITNALNSIEATKATLRPGASKAFELACQTAKVSIEIANTASLSSADRLTGRGGQFLGMTGRLAKLNKVNKLRENMVIKLTNLEKTAADEVDITLSGQMGKWAIFTCWQLML